MGWKSLVSTSRLQPPLPRDFYPRGALTSIFLKIGKIGEHTEASWIYVAAPGPNWKSPWLSPLCPRGGRYSISGDRGENGEASEIPPGARPFYMPSHSSNLSPCTCSFIAFPFFVLKFSFAMLVSFLALALLSSAQLARVNGIPLLLYTDHVCLTPSASNPNVTLELNVCAITTGLESFILDPTPCTTGNVQGWTFLDTACRNPGPVYSSGNIKYCYAPLEGGGIGSVMLTCDQSETTPPTPVSTTTIVVGPVANPITSNSSSSSSTSTGGTSDQPAIKSWWDSLSRGTRIAFIVALAVGVPLLVVLVIIGRRNREPGTSFASPYFGTTTQQTTTTQTTTTRTGIGHF
jgi:hypothetical protein